MQTDHPTLVKTREALRTLHSLPDDIRHKTRMTEMHCLLCKYRLHGIFALLHIFLLPITRRILCSLLRRLIALAYSQPSVSRFYKLRSIIALLAPAISEDVAKVRHTKKAEWKRIPLGLKFCPIT